MTLNKLRKLHPTFVYQGFNFKYFNQNLIFNADFFVAPNIEFHPQVIIFNVSRSQYQTIPQAVLKNMAFHFGLAEIPSYWKAACSPTIIIEAGNLNKNQLKWWKNFIIEGLGEFFFNNQVDFTAKDFLTIKTTNRIFKKSPVFKFTTKPQTALVPIGGGKDSIVTLELLKSRFPILLFSLNPTLAAQNIIKSETKIKSVVADRKIDPVLLGLNQKGYLNGHTPFSGYLAFLLVLIAMIEKTSFIAVSNEAGANEGNVRYYGKIINHQYSKSFNFEKLFAAYSKKYLSPSIRYFSFLRPLHEIQIAKLFVSYPEFFLIFRSCNVGQKQNHWCGQCPKCLFVYLILSAFTKPQKVTKIFGKDLLDDPSLIELGQKLLGVAGNKPFECVGTYRETLAAYFLSLERRKNDENFPALLKFFQREILPGYPKIKEDSRRLLTSWNQENLLPEKFERILRSQISAKL